MSSVHPTVVSGKSSRHVGVSLPQPVWLILLALVLGLLEGLDASALIKTFGAGFGGPLGSFALILIPSFVLAACFARQTLNGAPKVAAAIAPITAAGMVCPDTAYAALSSVAKDRKLSVAFGSYAGYRLLFPAGPLIVATGLGTDGSGLFLLGVVLLIPVWLAGELWARYRIQAPIQGHTDHPSTTRYGELLRALFPLLFLGALLIAGGLFNFAALSALDFLTRPKGALLLAAAVSVWMTHPEHRRECLDVALRRCSSLLLVIGAASAFGLMLIKVLPIADLLPNGSVGAGQIAALFLVSVIFKIAYGSSTVALATVTSVLAPVVTPMLQTGAISIPAAIFAICLGSLVIIPTDSFYWLVRSDALGAEKERSAIITLGGGAAVQAGVGLLVLIAISALHII